MSEDVRTRAGRRALRAVRSAEPDRTARGSLTPDAPPPSDYLDELLADLTLSRNEIARRTGLGRNTVSARAAKAGRTFDRPSTAAALEARVMDVRSRRVQLAELLVEDAHREREILAELGRDVPGMTRVQHARTVATLSRAVVELDQAEAVRARAEAEIKASSGVDDYLRHMAGEQVG